MSTLLLRLAAPIQSWGDESKYDIRQTRTEPSKSAVIGLIASALGLPRDSEEIPRLSGKFRMGVRVDMPGRMIMDFHTARPPKRTNKGDVRYEPNGDIMLENAPYVTYRYYLCDACFLVGLEGEDEDNLNEIAEAISHPRFPLYLGRRACPPTLPLCLGIRSEPLEQALRNEPWHASEWYKKAHTSAKLPLVLEAPRGTAASHMLRDEPVSFSPIHRRFAYRVVGQAQSLTVSEPAHDPFTEL